MATALPAFLFSSPAGLHIREFHSFLQSGFIAPVSDDQEKSHWASEPTAVQVSQMFSSNSKGATPSAILGANLLIYNKSRDTDRVCPACLRWYRVGEAFKSYSGLEEFTARPVLVQPEVEQEVADEQELSGICTRYCMRVLNEGSDAVFGKDADMLSATDVASMNSNVTGGFKIRKATDAEQAQGFKLVFTFH